MKKTPRLFALLALALAATAGVYLVLTPAHTGKDWARRRVLFQEAANRAAP